MLFDQPFGDGKAQPGSFANTLGRRPHLIKLIENRLVLILRDTDSRVANREFPESIADFALDANPPPSGVNFTALLSRL